MLLATAIAFGFLGSLHCLGMCAPLLWAIPEKKEKRAKWWLNKLAYNLGRIVTYSALGVLIGVLGRGVSFVGFQQHLSWITGVILIIGLFFSLPGRKVKFFQSFGYTFNSILKKTLSRFLGKYTLKSQFIFGILNGLLPCGLVYMALIASLSMSSITGSGLYMMLFGLGTVPMMLGAAFFKKSIQSFKRFDFNKLYPKIVLLIGCLLIIRGLNLGVPYLSPKLNQTDHITVCKVP